MLIKGNGADKGDVDMSIRSKERDQREQTTNHKGYPALDVEETNPTHAWPEPPLQQYRRTRRADSLVSALIRACPSA